MKAADRDEGAVKRGGRGNIARDPGGRHGEVCSSAGAYLASASGACVTMRKDLLLGSAIGDCELDVKPLKGEVRSRFVQDGEKGVLVNQPNGIFRR